MIPADRDILASFLESDSNYAPKSGEIVGILKTMHDEMTKDFADATKEENAAIASSEQLIASKKKEIEALTKAIESKTVRVGELAVKIAEEENDLEDTQEGLAEDKKFLKDLDKNCELKKDEWAEYKKMEAMESVAIADTIKMLNSDDALELFKKTVPAAAASFMQIQVSAKAMRSRALEMIREGQRAAGPRGRTQLDLLAMALHGKKVGFDKVLKLIDEMVATLKQEQKDDDAKKEHCAKEFDTADDKKKSSK